MIINQDCNIDVTHKRDKIFIHGAASQPGRFDYMRWKSRNKIFCDESINVPDITGGADILNELPDSPADAMKIYQKKYLNAAPAS